MIQKFQEAEQTFIPADNLKNTTRNLKDFIAGNFEIPTEDLERINEFIRRDQNLENIIFDIPKLIQSRIPCDKLEIRFYEEFQNDELTLEVTAFSSLSIEDILNIEDEFTHELYKYYPEESADKILILIDGYYE